MKVTVFTPLYNRSKFLSRLNNCLTKQTYKNFEWLIIDDGSTDGAKEVLEKLKETSEITINYHCQSNSGKHVAINKAIEEAEGEIFMILDSDDLLAENSLEIMIDEYKKIRNQNDIIGIAFSITDFRGNIFSNSVKESKLICTPLELHFKYRFNADVCDTFWTEKFRNYPFPSFRDENYCKLTLVWYRISEKYKVKYLRRKDFYFAEYLEDGLTKQFWKKIKTNPRGSMLAFSELTKYDLLSSKEKKDAAMKYWEIALSANHISFYEKLKGISLKWTIVIFFEKIKNNKKH